MHACMHACMHVCSYSPLHTCIHVHARKYTHTLLLYINTCACTQSQVFTLHFLDFVGAHTDVCERIHADICVLNMHLRACMQEHAFMLKYTHAYQVIWEGQCLIQKQHTQRYPSPNQPLSLSLSLYIYIYIYMVFYAPCHPS
jgi:hypothetical protein